MSYYYESKPDTKNYHYINHKTSPFVASHFHSAIEMIIVRRGRMLATINGEEIVVGAGQGCFVYSFCLHSYSELDSDTEVYAFVGNSADFELIFADVGGVPPVVFEFSDYSLLDKIVGYYKNSATDGVRYSVFRGGIALVLSDIAVKNEICPFDIDNRKNDICAVLKYISEHFREELTLNSLADEFGYSPQYFSKMFHRYMKINLNEYINIARVNHACRLILADSERSVADIAFESGFSSMPSFYRAYKRVFGKLPRD